MKKGVVLVVVIGVVLVICALALAAIFLMTQESRIAEHKIKRNRAFFSAQAGMVLAWEQLRLGAWVPGSTYCLSNGTGPALSGCTATVTDANIAHDVRIVISAVGGGAIAGTSQVDITVANY